jgi:hypothetical protein
VHPAESRSSPTDWSTTSGCSPPRLATTQLPLIFRPESACLERTRTSLDVCAWRRTRRRPGPPLTDVRDGRSQAAHRTPAACDRASLMSVIARSAAPPTGANPSKRVPILLLNAGGVDFNPVVVSSCRRTVVNRPKAAPRRRRAWTSERRGYERFDRFSFALRSCHGCSMGTCRGRSERHGPVGSEREPATVNKPGVASGFRRTPRNPSGSLRAR